MQRQREIKGCGGPPTPPMLCFNLGEVTRPEEQQLEPKYSILWLMSPFGCLSNRSEPLQFESTYLNFQF